jgi:hypothetical protein
MVKFLTTVLGGLTALAVAGLATPLGQAVLGMHQTQPTVPLSVIADPGAANAAAPVRSGSAPRTEAAPVSHRVYRPAVQPVPTARPVARPVPAGPVGIVMAGAAAITNVLLKLPQVLPKAGAPFPQVGPALPETGGWGPPERRDHRGRHQRADQGDGGAPEHH